MKRFLLVIIAVFAFGLSVGNVVAQPETRIGGGVHYWRMLDDIKLDDIDEDGLAYMLSYQYDTGTLLTFELDLEIFPERVTGWEKNLYAPQAFVLIGGGIYAGLGIGMEYYDGDFLDDTFYVARAGFNMNILPGLYLDINANYQFNDLDKLGDIDEEIDTDTLTLGAVVRVQI